MRLDAPCLATLIEHRIPRLIPIDADAVRSNYQNNDANSVAIIDGGSGID